MALTLLASQRITRGVGPWACPRVPHKEVRRKPRWFRQQWPRQRESALVAVGS
jgi:hypothetical protein